jgi:hypothetical protein
MTRRRLQLIVVAAFLFSLPSIPLVSNASGGGAGVLLMVCLLAMLVGGLLVARRI